MKNAFAVIHTWPDLRNAEYEVLQRILGAAKRVDVAAVVIDDNANVLWASPELLLTEGEQLPDGVVDFVLSLHFLSPRVVDAYSYITLWQPIDFYHTHGYQKSIDNVASHNDLISCSSDVADRHGLNLLHGLGRQPLTPLPLMFHMLPEPFLGPNVTSESRLFYIGINWERLGASGKGRFQATLQSLDRKGYTDIYGPEQIHGVAVWEGYETYRGELPFDGESVKNAINQAGICLALSSNSHKNAGIMSNRLFEGLAGGAAIIATPNPLIDKYFADVVYFVDDSRGDVVLGQQIVEAMRRIRANPEEATRRVFEGQRILREVCSLERSIQALFAGHEARQAHHDSVFLTDVTVSLVLVYSGGLVEPLTNYLRGLSKQRRASLHLHIICSSRFAARHGAEIAAEANGALASIALHPARLDQTPAVFDGRPEIGDRTGAITLDVLHGIDTDYFAFVRIDEEYFQDHFATIAGAMQGVPTAMAGCSGMIIRSMGADRIERRSFDSARFTDFDSVVLVNGVGQVGRFLYRAALLKSDFDTVMPLLDGEEHAYFRLASYLSGPIAQSSYATFVQDERMRSKVKLPAEPVEHQQQYIRDLFARDPRWLDRLSKGSKIPEFVYAYSPGTPIRWDAYTVPSAISRRIELNKILLTSQHGEGVQFLGAGFGSPEARSVWVEAERAIIEFNIPDNDDAPYQDLVVALRMIGRRSIATGRHQHCTFTLNGHAFAYDKIPDVETDIQLRLPIHIMTRSKSFSLELTPDHSEQVYDADGKVIDPRRLSMTLLSLTVLSLGTEHAPPILHVNETMLTARDERGADALSRNFYPPEIEYTWLAGKHGTIKFRLRGETESIKLALKCMGRASQETGEPQSIVLKINGQKHGPYILTEPTQIITADIEKDDLGGRSVSVEIEASHAEPVRDVNGEIVDSRLLGLALYEITLYEIRKRNNATST